MDPGSSEDDSSRTQEVAEAVRLLRHPVAAEVTRQFLEAHPDWIERYGGAAEARGIEDALFHCDFLASSLEMGSPEAFVRYTRWAAEVLEARGIRAHHLAENLSQLAEALGGRLVEEDAALVERLVSAGISAISSPRDPEVETADPEMDQGPLTDARALFVQALLSSQRKAAGNIAEDLLRRGHAPLDIYTHLFAEAMAEVGRLWQANRIGVADEHRATAIAQGVAASLYTRLPASPRDRGRALLTGVEGERHQFGLQLVSDCLEHDGWEVQFLGTDLPLSSIVAAAREQGPDLVGIGVTMPFNLPSARKVIRTLREALHDHAPGFLVGGRAFAWTPEAVRVVGADAHAPDLPRTLQRSRELARSASA